MHFLFCYFLKVRNAKLAQNKPVYFKAAGIRSQKIWRLSNELVNVKIYLSSDTWYLLTLNRHSSSADNILSSRTNTDDDFSAPGSASSSRRPSKGSRRGSSYRGAMGATGETIEENPPKQYRVTMLGATGVGKSALTSQFLSSDHMNTYDTVGKLI